LVVTADDFGADEAVNEAVAIAHRDGVLTAASLMVNAPAAAEAVKRARATPTLRVGLHLVLVEGLPALSPADLPHLTDGEGRFRTDMARAGATMFFNPAARRELDAEITAQFEAFAATGLPLDHVNAHKHFHLHPTIAGAILRIGPRFGMRAARLPLEPRPVLAALETLAVSPVQRVIDLWGGLARARFRAAGILTPDRVFGLAWSGAMDASRLEGLMRRLQPGLSEIYLHPALEDEFPGSAPGYAYRREFEALIAPSVIAAARGAQAALGGFADFAPA
jgi:hopanoid biosynthesis associated protein HpnK